MKKIITYLALVSIFCFTFIVLAPNTGHASSFLNISNQEGLTDIAGEFNQSVKQPKDPREIVASVIKTILGLLGIVLVTILVWAGYKYMTASGNEDKVASAQKQIIQAIIGLVIVLAAFSITFYIADEAIKASGGRLLN